jgi:MFS family permease
MSDGLWSPGRRSLTIGLILTITVVAVEALAVSTIMPIVAGDLGDIELYGWVFSSFLLGSLIGIAVVGGLIDRLGLVVPFVGGLGIFSIGLLICGLAPTMPVLVVGRFVQGFGAGAIPPIAYVAIGRSMPDRLRPQMFALLATAWVVPGIFGPVIAAAVATQFQWRAVFIGLLPIIVLSGAFTLPPLMRVPPSAGDAADRERAEEESSWRRVPRALLLAASTGLLIAGLTASNAVLGIPIAVVGLVAGLFAFRSLTPPGTLRLARGLPAAILLRGALTFSFLGADAFVPLALQGWRGESAEVTGIVVTVATLSWTMGSWLQTRRIAQLGPAWFVRVALLMVTVGLIGTSTYLLPQVPIVVGTVFLSFASLGIGLGYSAVSIIVLRNAPPGREGASTSALQLSDVLGTVLGTGLGGAFVAAGARAGAEAWVGLAWAFGLTILVGALGFVGSWRLFPDRSAPVPAATVPADVGDVAEVA